MLVVALLIVVTGLLMIARGGAIYPQSAWFRASLIATAWAYFVWCWTHGGQTVGMRAWRLRLVANDGGLVTLTAATLRFAAAWLSALAAGLGFFWRLIDRDRRSWHGRLSKTRLTVERPLAKAKHRERGD